MRKTFIEAFNTSVSHSSVSGSLPLMRKTFIEAWKNQTRLSVWQCLFRLCGRLSLRLGQVGQGSGAGVEGLFRLCGRLSLRPRMWWEHLPLLLGLFRLCGRLSLRRLAPAVDHVRSQSSLFRLCGRLSLRQAVHPNAHLAWFVVSSAYAEDFH